MQIYDLGRKFDPKLPRLVMELSNVIQKYRDSNVTNPGIFQTYYHLEFWDFNFSIAYANSKSEDGIVNPITWGF